MFPGNLEPIIISEPILCFYSITDKRPSITDNFNKYSLTMHNAFNHSHQTTHFLLTLVFKIYWIFMRSTNGTNKSESASDDKDSTGTTIIATR